VEFVVQSELSMRKQFETLRHKLAQNKIINLFARNFFFKQYVSIPEEGKRFLFVRFDITNKCNLRCVMCSYSLDETNIKNPAIYMNINLFEKIAKQMFPYAHAVSLSCSFEPLLHKQLADFLKIIDFYKVPVWGFVTNALLLNEEMIENIIKYNVPIITVSIDGATKETYEKIRLGANFDKFITNIRKIIELKKRYNVNHPKLYYNYVLMKSNIKELPDFINLAKGLDAEFVTLVHMFPRNRLNHEYLGNHKELFNTYMGKAKEIIEKHKIPCSHPELFDINNNINSPSPLPSPNGRGKIVREYQPENYDNEDSLIDNNLNPDFKCFAPYFIMHINSNGEVFPCSSRLVNKPYGDFKKQSFFEIWNSVKYLRLRKGLKTKKLFGQCKHCEPFTEDEIDRSDKLLS